MKAALESRVTELKLQDRVLFLPHRPMTELPGVMNALDALVLPSRTTPRWKEQFGRVIIEAHACSTPVIGSDSGAIPDVVGAAGATFPEGDAQALAHVIQTLRDDPDATRKMGELGRQRVEAEFTWKRVAQRLQAVYERVTTAP